MNRSLPRWAAAAVAAELASLRADRRLVVTRKKGEVHTETMARIGRSDPVLVVDHVGGRIEAHWPDDSELKAAQARRVSAPAKVSTPRAPAASAPTQTAPPPTKKEAPTMKTRKDESRTMTLEEARAFQVAKAEHYDRARLDADEIEMLDRTDPRRASRASSKASTRGQVFSMPQRPPSQAEARTRLEEIERELGNR